MRAGSSSTPVAAAPLRPPATSTAIDVESARGLNYDLIVLELLVRTHVSDEVVSITSQLPTPPVAGAHAAGSITVNVEPSPTIERTRISPPCALTTL
ncbi:hypothetical protein BH11MYX3_BH11MYX3_24170 [soil metagenome]